MSGRVHAEAKAASKSSFVPVRTGLLAGFRGKEFVSQPPLVQAKLTINQPNDRYEQEADRVADVVMRMSEPHVQRQVEEEELIQAKSGGDATPAVTHDLESQIDAIRDGGKPLSESERTFFEMRFGVNFGQVNVHTGAQAAESAQVLNARAYTLGQDVVFGRGQYAPETTSGRRLMAHELTHVVQQSTGRASGDADALQRWEEYQILGPLGPVDETIGPAVRTNSELGFSIQKIGLLKVRLGLPGRPPVLERRFVEALRRFQSGDDPVRTEEPAGGEEVSPAGREGRETEAPETWGARPSTPSGSASGILDEDTIFNLDIGSRDVPRDGDISPRQFYRERAPWRNITIERFNAIRSAIVSALRVDEDQINLVTNRRGHRIVEVSDRFIAQLVNWQLWHKRTEDQTSWGKLRDRDLTELVALPATPPPSATPETEAGHAVEETVSTAGATAESVPAEPEEDALDEQGLTSRQRGQLESDLEIINVYHSSRYRCAQGASSEDCAARRQHLDEGIRPQIEEIRNRVMEMNLPHADTNLLEQLPQFSRVHVRVQNLHREIRILLGMEQRQREPAADAAAAESLPLERRSLEESMGALEEQRYIIEQRTLVREGWDPRIGPDYASVQAAAQSAVRGLQSLKARMESWLQRIQWAVAAQSSFLEAFLVAIPTVPFRAPRLVRSQWQPSLPNPATPENLQSIGGQIQYARRWRNSLQRALQQIDRQIRRNQGYDVPSIRIENPRAVVVNLHRSGITITNNQSPYRPLRMEEMHLDPVFADAMVRFLTEMRGIGVTEMTTAGFLRDAMSPMDTHPRGQACDITGFKFSDELLHLRSGLPRRPPREGDSEEYLARYNHPRLGHSDWFDHAGQIGSMSHEHVFHAITNSMRTYFSRIVGPGHNRGHMGHWHVELTEGRIRGEQIRAIARDVDQPSWVTQRADIHEQGWRTPSEE